MHRARGRWLCALVAACPASIVSEAQTPGRNWTATLAAVKKPFQSQRPN